MSCRHPDFDKIHATFLQHYSKDPVLAEARYAEWVRLSELDGTKGYYSQAAERAAKANQSFEWAKFLLQFVREDQDNRYYKVEALFPVESMNKDSPPFTRDEVLQSARSLTGKPSNLNHDPSHDLKGVEVVAAQFEDDCVECLVKVPKSSPLIGMIDRKEIVSVSIEGEWSHGIPGFGLVLTGLAWLTKNTTLPGIPLTRIIPVERIVECFDVKQRVLEQLKVSLFSIEDGHMRLKAKELLEPLTCVFCGAPGEYLVSTCASCGDKAALQSNGDENLLEEQDIEKIAEKIAEKLLSKEQTDAEKQAQIERSQKYGIGIKKDTNLTKPSEYSSVAEDQFADPVNFKYPVDKTHVQDAIDYFNKPENRADYSAEEQGKILQKIVSACLADGIEVKYQPNDAAYKALPEELKAKCQGYTKESTDAERLAVVESKLKNTEQIVENLKKIAPGIDLLKDPPVLMPVSEHITVLEGLLPSAVVEHSSMGMQRQCQAVRSAIFKAKAKIGGK